MSTSLLKCQDCCYTYDTFLLWLSMGKVLLGESPECGLDILPSKAGVQTVLEVLQIQKNFWPTLGPRFSDLQSQWGTYCLKNKSEDLSALLMHSSIMVQS